MDQLLCWWPVRNHPQPWLDVPPMSGPGVVHTHEACLHTELELINCTMSCLPLHVQKTCADFCSIIRGEYYHQLQIRDCFRKLRESCGKGEARTSTKKKEKKLTFVDFQGVFCLEILGKQVSSPQGSNKLGKTIPANKRLQF